MAIVQARMGSTRLPGKTLVEIAGKSMLGHVIDRLKLCITVKTVVVATTRNKEDEKIVEFCRKTCVDVFAGSEDDVLDRYVQVADYVKADIIIRITGDCPLIDPYVIDDMVRHHLAAEAEYTCMPRGYFGPRTFPRGLDTEVISFEALKKAHKLGKSPHHREHVTPFIYEHPDIFKIEIYKASGILLAPELRLCVDTEEDLALIREIYSQLYVLDRPILIKDVIKFLKKHPELANMNKASEEKHHRRDSKNGIKTFPQKYSSNLLNPESC